MLDVVSPWILPFAIVAPQLIDCLQAEPTTCITCSFLLGRGSYLQIFLELGHTVCTQDLLAVLRLYLWER